MLCLGRMGEKYGWKMGPRRQGVVDSGKKPKITSIREISNFNDRPYVKLVISNYLGAIIDVRIAAIRILLRIRETMDAVAIIRPRLKQGRLQNGLYPHSSTIRVFFGFIPMHFPRGHDSNPAAFIG